METVTKQLIAERDAAILERDQARSRIVMLEAAREADRVTLCRILGGAPETSMAALLRWVAAWKAST